MYREIICLVFVAILASIGQGRVIEKRSPGVASDDAGSALGDFFGDLGRKKRSSWDHEEDLGSGVGSDIWDQIDKGSAAIGRFPTLIEFSSGGGKQIGRYQYYQGPFKNFVLDETRAYTAKALGKYYGDLLYQSFISNSAHRTTDSKFQILAINFLIVYFLSKN